MLRAATVCRGVVRAGGPSVLGGAQPIRAASARALTPAGGNTLQGAGPTAVRMVQFRGQLWAAPTGFHARPLSSYAARDLKGELKAMMLQTRNKELSEDERADAKAKLTIIKGVMAGVKNAEIAEAAKGAPASDQLQVQVVQSMIKKGIQAADEFTAADRSDLADKEMKEVGWLKEYLPPQMARTELDAIAQRLVSEMNATSLKDMGKVIGAMVKEVGPAATGGDISAAVKQAIAGEP